MRNGYAEVNGTRLYYEVSGVGLGLVLIHGFSLDHRMWDDQFEAFAQNFLTIRYDSRGFGRSALPTSKSYTHVEDLIALLDFLEVPEAIIVGHSMGGAIAVDFGLEAVHRTRALILVESALTGFPRTVDFGIKGKGYDLQREKQIWLAHTLFAPTLENTKVAARIRDIVADYSGWHWNNQDSIRRPETPAIHQLHTIDVPTLILIGQRDLPDFHKIASILYAEIRNSKMVTLVGVGHMPNMEDPSQFSEICKKFLFDLSKSLDDDL